MNIPERFRKLRARIGAATGSTQDSNRDAAIWAIRLFLGREPVSEDEIRLHSAHANRESLRTAFARTAEFRAFLRGLDAAGDYRMPLFLLEPPTDARLAWRFAPPSLKLPVSQVCTEAQFHEPEFAHWCRALDLAPRPHRKVWEFCYIFAVLAARGALKPGARALGFGVGHEPVPALLAKMGLDVVATDAPPEAAEVAKWTATHQHASALEALDRPNILPFSSLAERVAFRPVDMNSIPSDLRDFDICWSSCALEHLGSLKSGLEFIEASLGTLKPGGIAVHTTEFNLASNDATLESPPLSLYRKRDIEQVLGRLTGQGHAVLPLNLFPGSTLVDQHVDLPPYETGPHLKIKVMEFVTTSIGVAIEKASHAGPCSATT